MTVLTTHGASTVVIIRVDGTPAPGGSKSAFPFKSKDGRMHARIVDAGKGNKAWKSLVAWEGRRQFQGPPIQGLALCVRFEFTMPRPKSHYRTGKHAHELRPDAPKYHIVKPDATKLVRSTEDALTGIVWADDSTVMPSGVKFYGDRPGVTVIIERL